MTCNIYYITWVSCIALNAAAPLASAQVVIPQIRLPLVARPPVVEDYLSGTPPQGEFKVDGLKQRDPYDGEPVSERTIAYLSYDADHLYVAFVCLDQDPTRIRARLSKRDAIAQDDQVLLMLDTFHDRQRSYLFAANPLGIQADALASEGRDDDYSFDTVWRTSGRLVSGGFVVLLAIPFKSLRISTSPSGTWGMALSRIIPRNSEQSFWPHITRRVEGLTQQFATVARPAGVEGGRNIQVIPYAAVSSGRYLDHATSRFTSPIDRRIGLDAKFVLRDAIAVDVAVNPDFSQVESDQPQVAVNQRFELFYPEKRPFFLESASVFKYVRTAPSDPTTRVIPDMLFFSRRVQNPEFGVRVTGKSGPWSFGGIVVDDRGVGASSADDARARIGVGRVQREFSRQSTLGVFVTSRARAGVANHVGALDVRWKFSPNWIVSGQAVASRSDSPDGSQQAPGSAYNASLFYSSRRALYSLFYSDRSPAFRTTLGFVPRIDIRQVEQYTEYRWRPRSGPVVAYGPNSYVRVNWNHRGELQEWIVRFPFEVHLKGRTQVFVRRVESYELFQGLDLRAHFQTINVTTEWLKWLSLTEGFEWGRTPNYFPARGIQPYVTDSVTASLGLTFRPTPRLRYELTYLHSSLTGNPSGSSRNTRVFRNDIARSTLNYQFTRELSLRAILDYNAVVPNPSLVQLIDDRRLGIDALFTYQLGPSTALYVGYTTGFQNVALSPEAGPVARTSTPTTQVGRQLLAKMSYLFRL
ncbi:MAG TPA: DUF5916 domain-containing protein [Vicinamibacterales bacterium]|nr:DUF5916 domain-containing protein [Vicinamibacterales bacterium]